MEFFQRIFGKNPEIPPKKKVRITAEEQLIVDEFEKKFQLSFHDPSFVITAMKHRSYLNVSNEERIASNERLEFLGDAVLDLVVTHHLYQKFPKRTEGQLSKIKSILVSKPVLAEIANALSLGTMILINRGEEKTGGRKRQSILADCFEAVVGAIYLDLGIETAELFIQKYLLIRFKSIMQRELYKNYKSILLEYAQSELGKLPEYRVVRETGPDHEKKFEIVVKLNGKEVGKGNGKSKKVAEQEAAKMAIQELRIDRETG